MAELTKRVKRLMRECAAAAHEAELHRALLPLAEAFQQWARGDLDSFALSEMIHKFHQGPAREIWVRYTTNQLLPSAIAHAIATGALDRAAVPAEVLDHVVGLIEFYETRDES